MRYLVLGAAMALSSLALAQIPQQSQASNLAVPEAATAEKTPPANFTSLIIVDQCKMVSSIVGVNEKGELFPLHFTEVDKDRVVELLIKLERTVPADNVLEITLPCKSTNLSGLPNV